MKAKIVGLCVLLFAATALADGFAVVTIDGRNMTILNSHAEIEGRFAAGHGPHGVAYGNGVLAVTNSYDDTVDMFSVKGKLVVQDLHVGDFPEAIAFGDGVFAIAAWFSSTITFVDEKGKILRRIAHLPNTIGIGYADGIFAAAHPDHDSVSFFNSKGEVLNTFVVGRKPLRIIPMGKEFAVSLNKERTIALVNPQTGLSKKIDVGPQPYGISYVEGQVAVVNNGNNTLTLFPLAHPEQQKIVSLAANAREIEYGEGKYVITHDSDRVSFLDFSGNLLHSVEVAGFPIEITYFSE